MNRSLLPWALASAIAACGGSSSPSAMEPSSGEEHPAIETATSEGVVDYGDGEPIDSVEPPDAEPEPPEVHDDAPSAERLREELRQSARYDYALMELLSDIPAAPADAESSPERARAMLDLLVRHALPYVWEYVFMGSDGPEALRLPRSLVSAPPVTNERSRLALGRVLRTYVAPLEREVARLEALEAPEDPVEQAGAEAELESTRRMLALVRDSIVPLLQQREPPTPDFVVDVALEFVAAAGRVDIEGSDTADRARGECARMLRVLATGTIDPTTLPPLRAARPR